MPKIKLSALASDIKGKANGSVFSTNSGGTYFRNNPSGGGRKSPKWDIQKNNFGSLATQWKALTQEQQEAWQDATVLYPTVNAFGDPRIPSGYELFMRLNGSLSAVGLPLLSIPNAPRSVVEYGDLRVDYPTQWQLTPNYACQTFNNQRITEARQITCIDAFKDQQLMNNITFSMRVIFQDGSTYPLNQETNIPLMSIYTDIDNYMSIFIQIDKEQNLTLQVAIKGDSGEAAWEAALSSEQLFKGFHFAMFFDKDIFADSSIWIDGTQSGGLQSSTGNGTDIVPGRDLHIGNTNDFDGGYFAWNDIKMFAEQLTSQKMYNSSQGYIIGTEVYHWGGTEKTDSKIPNYGSADPNFTLDLSSQSNNGTNGISVLYPLIPNFSIIVPNEPDEQMYLNIYASPPISNGITGSYNNFKLIATLPWTDQEIYNVWEQYQQVYANVPPNSQVLFRVQWIDATTGAKAQIASKPRKKKPRFKPSSELTDTVN